MIKIKGFYVCTTGDRSVGINPQQWEFKGSFYFENKQDLEAFRVELKTACALFADEGDLYIETFEEREDDIKRDEYESQDQPEYINGYRIH